MDSVFHDFNFLTFVLQLIIHRNVFKFLLWITLYLERELIVGTTGVGGLHKVKLNNNSSHYHVCYKQEPTGIQKICHFIY